MFGNFSSASTHPIAVINYITKKLKKVPLSWKTISPHNGPSATPKAQVPASKMLPHFYNFHPCGLHEPTCTCKEGKKPQKKWTKKKCLPLWGSKIFEEPWKTRLNANDSVSAFPARTLRWNFDSLLVIEKLGLLGWFYNNVCSYFFWFCIKSVISLLEN